MMAKRERDYTVGSGNVFADLGLPNPEEALAKAELAHKIAELIRARQFYPGMGPFQSQYKINP